MRPGKNSRDRHDCPRPGTEARTVRGHGASPHHGPLQHGAASYRRVRRRERPRAGDLAPCLSHVRELLARNELQGVAVDHSVLGSHQSAEASAARRDRPAPEALEALLDEDAAGGDKRLPELDERWGPEVDRALRELAEPLRAAILLVDIEQLPYEEAALALGWPVGTLRSRLFRARKRLFATLEGYARTTGYLRKPVRPE